MSPPTVDRTKAHVESHPDDRAALERLPCIDEILERLDLLEQADEELAGLAERADTESMSHRRQLDELGTALRSDIAGEILMIRSALRASVASDYPPGNRRAEDLVLLERLVDPDTLDKLDELNQSAEKLGREISLRQHAIVLERELVDTFTEGLRLLACGVSDIPAQDTETSALIQDQCRSLR